MREERETTGSAVLRCVRCKQPLERCTGCPGQPYVCANPACDLATGFRLGPTTDTERV